MSDFKTTFEDLLNTYSKFQKETLNDVFSSLTIVNVPKGNNIINQGEPDTNDYFLLGGILREYLIDDKANEVTLNFYNKNGIITPNFCRVTNNKNMYSIQALSECTIGIIEAVELERKRTENSDFSQGTVLMITKLFKDKLQKQIADVTQTASEKLAKFRDEFPGLENQVQHSYIASYLGITNVSLSRLRNQKDL